MRFRLTTLLAATFTAALLLGANVHPREATFRSWKLKDDGVTVIFYTTAGSAYGWPEVVYEKFYLEEGLRVYRDPWAIAVNLAFGLAAVGMVTFLVERLEIRRERKNQERMKA
ncbi:MAG: hypothetical protein AMXMBFR7_18590 [Planctomycetota bacterium]